MKKRSIFEFMKKYELPMPLWCYKPELEQDSQEWHTMGPRMLANKLKRFLDARTLHDQFLYRKLFPLPFDWDDWMPKEESEADPEAYIEKRLLRLRRWEPECPPWEDFPEEACLKILAGDKEEGLSPVNWESFAVRMHRENPYNTELYSAEHLLIMGYVLYRGNRWHYLQLLEEGPDSELWQDTLHKALNCRTPDWMEVLTHLLGVGLYRKFSQNNYLRIRLQETGDQPLVYVDETNPLLGGVFKEGAFRGENLYGKALMQVRSQLNRIYDNMVLCLGVQEEISEDVYGEPFDMPF
ncbi:MAG: NADAR family protein [Oscillospiraceae bacterium]|nr:NADAR family protein [Oscillospiraceae bacterium]